MSRQRAGGATEQPGNSFKYLYWRLSEKEFQQLCNALLKHKYDPVRCFPTGMADEGIDAITDKSIVYQVKWSSKLLQDPAAWLAKALDGERDKIRRLVEQGLISRYILMTSVAGTTAPSQSGSIQKIEQKLARLTKELGVPIECWWQSDIDAAVDAAPDAIKWSYQEMLAGSDAIRYLIHGSSAEGHAARMRDTMVQVMGTQWRDDAKIKFSQVDMDRVNLVDLFVDVPASLQASPLDGLPNSAHPEPRTGRGASGALGKLLATPAPLVYLVGVPGQGKSTIGQYLSQVHRAALLPGSMLGEGKPPEVAKEPRFPLRIDLKDYAAWLAGNDPFEDSDTSQRPRARSKAKQSLELFLAEFCSANSGGRAVGVEDVHSLLARYPTLLVLDGLDEIPNPTSRSAVVEQIEQTAARMAATAVQRAFQIVVTARPNVSGLAEPDKEKFQTLRLEPLTPDLQRDFVGKWCDANDIHGKERRSLRRTFADRTALDHVAQLADNPMQLTILLFLIRRKGEAVPVARTPLYTDYMRTLLDREVERKQIDRARVRLVEEVTSFLGWHMHSGLETEPSAGRMSSKDIETTLLLYLREIGGPSDQAQSLFTAASDRFWALTSKVDGFFEFAVQPVQEYFAARFLAEWAGSDRSTPLLKNEVLKELIERTYWANTARFYAGFAPPNELATLRYGLEEALAAAQHPLQERGAAWSLLSDGIFANALAVQRDVAKLVADELSVVLMSTDPESAVNFPRLTSVNGGDEYASALFAAMEQSPSGDLAAARAGLLRDRAPDVKRQFLEWWRTGVDASLGNENQNAWLNIGRAYGVPRLEHERVAKARLVSPEDCQAVLGAGASPETRSESDKQLVRAVLDGWCSDVVTTGSSEAGALLRAMRPQWYHQLTDVNRTGPRVTTGHAWIAESERGGRAAALNALVKIDSGYEELKRAANPRGKGQKGTTEPWQNAARVLQKLHGPSLLAAEIAVSGGASPGTLASGSIDRDGEPFGTSADYGTLVIKIHGRPTSEWWAEMHESYEDELSRTTWTLALLATAVPVVVMDHLDRVDEHLARQTDHDFAALAAASSRLGLSQPQPRLSSDSASLSATLGMRTKLVVSHFAAQTESLDPLEFISDGDLAAMAGAAASSWPILRAASSRMLSRPSAQILGALRKGGALAALDSLGPAGQLDDVQHIGEILDHPASYPGAWVVAAERQRSRSRALGTLAHHANDAKWVPRVPRL